MESREKRDELLGGAGKMHNVMEILSSLLLADKPWTKIGQGDQLNPKTKWNCNFPKIAALPPSEYMRQLLMTTEERIELLTRVRPLANQDVPYDLLEYNDFEVVPRTLLLQQYSPGNVYDVPLTIRNIGKTSRFLKLACEVDPIFNVTYKGSSTLNTRLAPGMFHTYNVRFSPDENRDYEYEIKFATDGEAVAVPIIAIGPRAILDFPDVIILPETAVKIPSVKSLLVRNLGNSVAVFNTSTSSPNFWLEPSKGIIEEEETVQFVVNFLSDKAGFFEDSFLLKYESGEVVRIKVQGSAIDCNVRLERGSVRMQEETYMGLSTTKTLKIFNRSEYIVKYRWMRYKDSETDIARKKEYGRLFEVINNAEIARCMDLVHYNICIPEAHELVCQRIYGDEIASLVNEKFLYKNSHFSLIPMEGEIWPQSSVDVTVHFQPDEIGELSSTAYLEVTGREDRLALSLHGISIGPVMKLNVATIDARTIFLCSVHNYQVVCTNEGFIPGVLVHKTKRSDFGGNITVTPKQLKLQPGQCDSFNISFSSNRNGDFVERIEFVVKESLEVVGMYIKGCVICPTLRFDKPQLDFGTVALGFTSKEEVTLHNDSLVPVPFSICVPNDGTEAVVTVEEFAQAPSKTSFPSSPREFFINPKEGVVAANSSLKITISFTPNAARIGTTSQFPAPLPISFQSKVAALVVSPEEIDIRSSFLNYPYARSFTVENRSDVDGYFYLVPQTISDHTTMLYSLSTQQGYLKAGQSKTVSLTIIARVMGKQKATISMLTFGKKEATACCVLTCNGQGPVISVQPTSLDWASVFLLREQTIALRLINDSPVPAEFTATLSGKNSPWSVFPTSGELGPGDMTNLEVTVFLRDVGKHVDKILVTIPNSRTIAVSLCAIGIGCCIVCDPPILPTFDMGLLFSHQDISLPIKVTNHGSRHLRLIFSNTMEMKMLRGQIQTPTCDKFSIEPFSIELPAQSTGTVVCNVRFDTCETISEQWWLHCFYDGQGKREILGNSNFTATFVEPSVSFSKKELLFCVNLRPGVDNSRQTDELFVTNTSGLNLNTHLTIDPPFGIIADNGNEVQSLKIILSENAKRRIAVFFSPMTENGKRNSKEYIGVLKLEYEEHPNADKIKCRANLNFPNVSSLPKEIRFNCPLSCSVVENIFLQNNGPLEVSYKFVWIEETISIKRDASDTEETFNSGAVVNEEEEDESENSELLEETRHLLLGILADNLVLEEPELEALEILGNEARVADAINRICSIVPCEAIIPAYSSQCISFGFHGTEALILEAQVLCEIEGGPAELIKVFAAADEIRFHLEKERVDFGQQMICEPSRTTIKLENCSNIQFIYHIELADASEESLRIEPMSAEIAAQSIINLELISRPLIPGRFDKSFKLCIEHHAPISIRVEGIAIISQVYLSLPRCNLFKDHSVELGYLAIQSLQNASNLEDNFEEVENGWQMVSKDETLPSATDIEMIVESLIAKEFIEQTYSFLSDRTGGKKVDGPIPYLFAPEYILEMGYVVVGQTTQASARVCNSGARSAKVRLGKPNKTDNLAKQGIHIYFREQTSLMPGEYANLEVTFNPTKLKPSEKSAAVRRKFHLEVTNGFTLPITISATVTYPFVAVTPKILHFGEVLIGECELLQIHIKNEGLIDCQWEAKLPPMRRNQSDGPFFLQSRADIYLPGQSGCIKVYFKPHKSGCTESKLTVHIRHGMEPVVVDLCGRGIEHKLKIVPSSIEFSPLLPYDLSEGKEFTIQNIGQRTAELYWKHLEQPSLHEDRVIRILAHYYQVNEILLPPRRPPDSSTLPAPLYEFYNWLADEMALSLATQRKKDAQRMEYYPEEEERFAEEDSVSVNTTRRKRRGSKLSRKLTRTASMTTAKSEANLSLSVLSEHEVFARRSNLSSDDPDEIETLLHNFMDELQKQPDFLEKMKDPVKEAFEALEKKKSLQQLDQLNGTLLAKPKKYCIIFHGAPMTEYQTAACKASRILGLPLLNLNNSLIEMIALGNTACSAKLRETIDTKYRDLLLADEKSRLEDDTKMCGLEELSTLDSLSRFEYKIEAIERRLKKERIAPQPQITPREGKASAKAQSAKSPKSPRVKAEETFLNIDMRLFIELLEQRLAMSDLSEGFVLQTLTNDFIHGETKTLTALLQILGNFDFPIFVTFHDSVETHESQNVAGGNSTGTESFDENSQKLSEIDQMSSSEFDLLSDADKDLYRAKVLLVRNEEAARRRMQFQQRVSDLRKQKKGLQQRLVTKDTKLVKSLKKSRSRAQPRSSQDSENAHLELFDKKKSAKADTAKSTERKTIHEEMLTVANRMDVYASNLESILSILQNWDPLRKTNVPSQKETAQSSTSKQPKSKDRPTTASSKSQSEMSNKFWIWHVKSTESWNPKICDMIISEIARHKLLLNATAETVSQTAEPDQRPQLYSVVLPKHRATIQPQSCAQQRKAFDLFVLKYNATSHSTEAKEAPEIDKLEPPETIEESLESRFVLEPHESRKFRVYFHPRDAAFHHDEFPLAIFNSNDSSYCLKVTGIGEVPRLNMDPSYVFKKIKETKKDELNEPTFFTDTQTFDFGSLLLAGKDNKAHRKKSSLKFWNNSKVDLELEISLMSSNWKTFDVEPRQLFIKPKHWGDIEVTASATKLGINEEQLVLLVKNNPRVEIIELRSNGTKLEVELEGKQIFFGKVLLYREVNRNLKVRNNSAIPIFWRITPMNSIDSQLKLSSSSGKTRARSESNVVFCYTADRISTMDNVKMNFKVYLNEEADYEGPLFTDVIIVSGETYDVAVDINSANPIAFGAVRVGSMTSATFTIKNRGNYDVKFVIEFVEKDKLPVEVDQDLRRNLKEDLQISPSFGNLLPDKITTINVNYLPKLETRLKEAPLLKCNLIDTNNDATIVAEFPLTVSIAAHYARFRLIPDYEISFGPIGVCSNKTLQLSIENTGIFAFKYQLKNPLLPTIIAEESSKKKKKDKSPRSTTTNKQGTSKLREAVPNLRIGPFTLLKIEGEIGPGDIETLAIDCYPETEGRLEERVIVVVEDSSPENRHGKSLLLNVDSRLPTIDFRELDAIFQDSFVVDDAQEFTCPKEIESHTVFSRAENCLYFKRVSINNSHTTSIRLYNRGSVPAAVIVSLRPDVLTPKTARSDTFALDTVRESIAPMSSHVFSVSFTPSLIETFNGILEAAVELPDHLKHEPHDKLFVKLSGEGCVPEVILIEPPVTKRAGNSAISFGKCLVDETSTKTLCIKNIGKITAKVIVKIVDDLDTLYTIRASDELSLRSLSEVSDSEEETNGEEEQQSIVSTLHPGEVARFFVDFQPRELGKIHAGVRLLVLDNPYENIALGLEGEGFVENVVIEGLPLVEMPKPGMLDKINGKARKSLKHRSSTAVSLAGSSITLSSQSLASTPVLIYELNYDKCFINKMNKMNFTLINKSRDRYFRFEWSSHPNVVFVPSIGHLQCSGSKDIVATFFAPEPMIHKQTSLECAVCEIHFPAEQEEENLWDDRRLNVEWVEVDPSDGNEMNMKEKGNLKKIVVPSSEPLHEIVTGTARTIQLLLSAIVAYSEYSCAVEEINFEDTLMFQSREYEFNLNNTGNVDLIFNWKIDMDAEYPTRLPDSVLRATSLKTRNARCTNDSRPSSRSSGGILYPEAGTRNYNQVHSRNQRGDELVDYFKPISRNKFSTMDITPHDCPCPPTSDLFSNSANLTQRTTETWIDDGDDQPFRINPGKGVIPAGESAQFTLRFSPLDVFDYKAYLTCQVENLGPNLDQLTIPITGRSLLPYCHFDIEKSDYLTSGRRDPSLGFPMLGGGDTNDLPDDFLNPRILEFKIVGIGGSHVKQFFLVNPTTEDYHFTWKDLTPRGPENLPYFHCAHEEGLAESGKRTNVVFNFFAEDLGTFESFWRFSIDKYNLDTIFLLVAIVTEPSVKCLNARLRMKPTILGYKVEDSINIVNNENFQLPFKVLPNSLSAEDGSLQTLVVGPMSGVLAPKCEQILHVSFEPSRVGDFTFPLRCQVKKMKNPLSLLISATVGKVMPRISYIADCSKSQQMLQIDEDRETILDFGKLTLNKPSAIKFEIANAGDVVFYYSWELGVEDCGAYILTISRRAEHVSSNSKAICYLELMALEKTVIRQHRIELKIERGPVYRMLVRASAKHPAVEFSFVKYDFGPCYVRDETSPPQVAQLFITNNDKSPAIIECNFVENLPHMTVNLETLSQAIPGHSTVAVTINFRPLAEMRYHENLIFLLSDSSIQQTISLKGEGIPYKISLENLRNKSIELGNVSVGKPITRKVRILNAGRAAAEVRFDLIKSLPGHSEHRRRLNVCQDHETRLRSKINSSESSKFIDGNTKDDAASMLRGILSIQPRDVVIPANNSIELVLKFKPTKRLTTFVEKIGAQVDSTIIPLFFVRGSCVDREFRLSSNHLFFGTVVEGCSSEIKLVLHNSGDFGARFKWNVAKLKPYFDLRPVSGYCSPEMDVTFTVAFHPAKQAPLIEAEASIEIEKYASLKVSCSGSCCKIPDSIEVLRFLAPVRSTQTKNLSITNDTGFAWNVETVVTGEYFHAEESFTVPANKSYSCSLTYAPLVMNSEKNPDQGRLLVKLPGNKIPLVYSLVGVTLPPEVLGKIVRQLPAKTKYAELLPVHNWLNKSQSFHCDIKLVNDLKAKAVLYTFTGNSRLDVPANGSRDFRALFYCYKEATLNFRITFTNQEGEYQFYEVEYKVTKPEVLSTIKLTTAARSSTCYLLQVDNPFKDRSVSFNASCQHPNITIQGVPKVVSAESSDKIGIDYSPFIPEESVAKLDINCPELGNFPYELRLKATTAAPEKVIQVTAVLGSSTTFSIVINNISKKIADFVIKVDDPSFTCNKNISVAPHKEATLEVTYEPCDTKNVKAMLCAASETLGEMLFPLIGSYSLPKPQGPFTISRNSSIGIVFKNVFSVTKTFEYLVTGDAFSIGTSSDVIKSKQSATIVVKFRSANDSSDGSSGKKYPATGKLIVSCVEPNPSQIIWVYYLKGSTE